MDQNDQVSGIDYFFDAGIHSGSHVYLKPVVDRFLTDIGPGSVVLDMGCGNGSFLSLYRNRGWKLFGVDFSTTGIAAAKQSYPEIQFVLANPQACIDIVRPALGSADVIISTEVIEHLYDPHSFLAEVFALLNPGGIFVLSTPYHGYLKNLAVSLAGKWDKHLDVLRVHGHIKFWSMESLYQALADRGFQNMKMIGAGRVPYLWKSMVVCCERPPA